jgi:oligopeptide transport system substrate-binding protein
MMSKIFYIAFFIVLLCADGCQWHSNASAREYKIVRIAMDEDPATLDPRKANDLRTKAIVHMLYEGLMRNNAHGKPIPAVAKEVIISKDQKTYTFIMRKSFWSNGAPLTAYDFVRTWTKILEPEFETPNASYFYLIKGAKEAKEGKTSIEEVGIKAVDPLTLVIELESATPYFLELLTTHFFYPVYNDFFTGIPVTNGPFKLTQWQRNKKLEMDKNPQYWEASNVRLNKILLLPLNPYAAMVMFENDELDWVGAPFGSIPLEGLKTLKYQHKLHIASAAQTYFFRINTTLPPLQSLSMRYALAYALDRKTLVENVLQENEKVATAFVPPSFGLMPNSYFDDHDIPKAWYAYQEALEQLKISKDEFPPITLCYISTGDNKKIAETAQRQWHHVLGINVQLESYEKEIFDERLARNAYGLALDSRFAEYDDALNFLGIFSSVSEKGKISGWQNAGYLNLLDQSLEEVNPAERQKILKSAQENLLTNMPIIPLFFSTFSYLKAETLFGVYISDLGYFDFKDAFYED